MKLCELKIISQKLATFRKIYNIKRVADNIIKIEFQNRDSYYFDLSRGESYIFKVKNFLIQKEYNAPFDILLQKYFTNAMILEIDTPKSDKILQIRVSNSSRYKAKEFTLQLEFTGKYTNAIILDEDKTVIEALRHIDISNSYREVKVGIKLKDLPNKDFEHKPCEIDDLDHFLYEQFHIREEKKLLNIKRQKIAMIQKKIKKLQKILNSLEDQESLLEKSKHLEYEAGLVLSNLHLFKPYQKELILKDYDQKEIKITLPKESSTIAHGANLMFSRAKKLKQKAKGLHKEQENLLSKIDFLEGLICLVENAKSSNEINLYLPKQVKKQQKRQKINESVEYFYFKGYKIGVGRNQKGNIWLLKNAKMSDIWMHLKDMPSTHVIIRTDKQKIDEDVLNFGAKLCVNFSTKSKGNYLVDYTTRRDVKMRDGANVNYVNYKTISYKKD
ncbi:MAG: hypothetical protein DSZ06_03275 [Sulfurospirillum sp.]|nr:MAG: hypothetical protein DSZ06_03275 [Sulfurospirillum sp.]